MEPNPDRVEAERLLGVAEKLLNQRDLNGSKEFAMLAQETEPLLDGSDQILAVVEVLLASDKRINNHHDWYSILQIDQRTDDQGLIKKQYRKLALLLHPDKNKYSFADQAFTLVAEAWAVLSDPRKKSPYDHELNLFTKIDLSNLDSMQQGKLPVRRNQRPSNTKRNNPRGDRNSRNLPNEDQRSRLSSFWTACPYCYILYEYPRVYENCCLRCENCKRGFHAALIPNLPPLVPGKEAYYCCWGFFPLGFVAGNSENGGAPTASATAGFPNWMPPLFTGGNIGGGDDDVAPRPKVDENANANANARGVAPKKRGRPRKNQP
ncbi:DnaJ domain-containing protein [Melia azedarach]|uniref:DnaJ domain-containing protein n=2 Tax=Melia azedarach TaxID=155640 RepID=A0ACC1WR06_MELAZ|nr:DnaJ domain-containing protein [Melia azedarach]KAJ4701452.1 DnaJ domain-containing protein [Melia azedarach]